MRYEFEGTYLQEGNRYFINIPFNVWEVCGQKGNIPVAVTIEQLTFECKLIPKGQGNYYIPLAKKFLTPLLAKNSLSISFKVIDQLSRINHDSPYSNPIRTIETLDLVMSPDEGLCGQACIAMLSGQPLDKIITLMKAKKWQASLSKMIETLDYFGLKHAEKMIYKKDSFSHLPKLCLLNVKGKSDSTSHLMLYFDKKFYDPASGIHTEYDRRKIIGYLEIYPA